MNIGKDNLRYQKFFSDISGDIDIMLKGTEVVGTDSHICNLMRELGFQE